MNFLDTYDIPEPATTPGTGTSGPEPTLNEEVSQVVGQLGRLWGGFRKQSQSVFETARKEVGQVVSQAQKELTKLNIEPKPQEQSEPPVSEKPTEETAPEAGLSSSGLEPADNDDPVTPTAPHHRGTSVSLAASNLFSKLQATLPSDIASTVQARLPDAITQGAGSVDFTQLRTTLATEFQRVQGITRAQAEEYVHKSEELLRDASEFLKEAVKVVPPEESGEVSAGVMWDGSDIWMLPEKTPTPDAKGKRKEKQSSAEGLRAVATRAEALLKQLKHDPAVLSVNPEADERAKQMWDEWLRTEVDNEEAGLEREQWKKAKEDALGDPADGEALRSTKDTLVPSVLSEEIFWKRYFFRVHQLSREEQRRKAFLQGTNENEEDIEWESDDEDTTPAEPSANESTKPAEPKNEDKPVQAVKASSTSTPATTSPRRSESEDGSYDVVSSQVSNNGEAKEEEPIKEAAKEKKKKDDDDEDSDWE
ncbi:uncharacterized protein PHACADRAFT_175113 [Phanerochaete carnosa HHB-10118-sp]|uniref:BSD domain-containing protein n=1 Tax=Phanerochaete carnosa (strain HHB-10118-sp) TaxID=650164 RepID=K5WVU8_PHACS|nr:uncharacterized protein PHACADRAFT_175113 [Phanerochaete carnosa HHB-10118-sp]EKM54587.1 hypothetical protein PHACADRAFT_175113 [Phanerochaete carnosa HHB-10118-sp]